MHYVSRALIQSAGRRSQKVRIPPLNDVFYKQYMNGDTKAAVMAFAILDQCLFIVM